VILLKSKIWHRDNIVGIILCFSVAKINMACFGGSSNVFRKALKPLKITYEPRQ
jgi:hypothetical protein